MQGGTVELLNLEKFFFNPGNIYILTLRIVHYAIAQPPADFLL